MLIALSEPRTQYGREDFVSRSFPQKVFPAIWLVKSEVYHDGFSRYFSNASAETAPFVDAAPESMRGPEPANLCQQATMTCAIPDGLPTTEEDISSACANFSAEVPAAAEPLDQEFCADPHDLTGILFAYGSQHAAECARLPKADAA
jgi:hypothetical protein